MEFEQTVEELTPLLSTSEVKTKPSPWYIIVPVFAIAFSFSSIIAPTIEVLSIIYCYKYYQSQTTDDSDIPLEQCNIPEVQSTVSQMQAIIMFLSCTSALLLANYYGVLSDRKGRRFVMQISMVGGIVSYAATILTLKYYTVFDVYLLFLGPFVRGLLAGEAILISSANAYLSDCTTAANRTLMFSRMIAAIYFGTTLGPSFSSFLIKETGTIASVFYMVILIHVLFLAYVTYILPESNELIERQQSFWQGLKVYSAFKIFYRTPAKHTSRWALPLLAVIQLIIMMLVMPPTLLYGMLQFGWTSYQGGLFISLAAFTRLVVTVAILPLATHMFYRFTTKRNTFLLDVWLIRIGMAVEIVAFVFFGLVTSSTAFTWTALLQGFAVLASPSIRSLTSILVDPSQLGELWGAMATVDACSLILCQLVINAIYSASVATMPNLTFFFCAGIAGLATVLAFCIRPQS